MMFGPHISRQNLKIVRAMIDDAIASSNEGLLQGYNPVSVHSGNQQWNQLQISLHQKNGWKIIMLWLRSRENTSTA
jgi:hypothetical protein